MHAEDPKMAPKIEVVQEEARYASTDAQSRNSGGNSNEPSDGGAWTKWRPTSQLGRKGGEAK